MTDELSLQGITNKMNNAFREKAEKRVQEQHRSLMYLIADFLRQQGLYRSCQVFTEEAHLATNFEVCDNVDLEIIFSEYSDYYHARFHKFPKFCKKKATQESTGKNLAENANAKEKRKRKPTSSEAEVKSVESGDMFELVVTPLLEKSSTSLELQPEKSEGIFAEEKVLRPLGNLYPEGSEYRAMAEIITREIVLKNLNVHWDDIFGLKECKAMLAEIMIYPTKYPELFSDLFRPPKGILLYGPPGTGKTMLAKAVATESKMTFFNITASSLVSKWRGDSEKYIRVLFELASYYAPSIIFIDEIDWIAACNAINVSDGSEPARRFRAELLSRLDGLLSEDNSGITLLAATNTPWCLDSALLRRLERHIHVNVPSPADSMDILRLYTTQDFLNSPKMQSFMVNLKELSGADLKRICREAWFIQMQPVFEELESSEAHYRRALLDKYRRQAPSITEVRCFEKALHYVLAMPERLQKRYQQWKAEVGRM